MDAVVTAPEHAVGGRVALAVSTLGLATGKPWTLTLDGQAVQFFAERADALHVFGVVSRAIDG